MGGGQSGTLTLFQSRLLTGQHLANSRGGQLKKTPCIILHMAYISVWTISQNLGGRLQGATRRRMSWWILFSRIHPHFPHLPLVAGRKGWDIQSSSNCIHHFPQFPWRWTHQKWFSIYSAWLTHWHIFLVAWWSCQNFSHPSFSIAFANIHMLYFWIQYQKVL